MKTPTGQTTQFAAAALTVFILTSTAHLSLAQQPPPCYMGPADWTLELTRPDGTVTPLSGFRNKWLVLTFWATWVPPSRGQLVSLNNAFDEWHKRSVEVLAVAIAPNTIRSLSEIASKNKLTIPLLAAMDERRANDAFKLKALPTTFVINPDGVITHCVSGVASSGELDKYLK